MAAVNNGRTAFLGKNSGTERKNAHIENFYTPVGKIADFLNVLSRYTIMIISEGDTQIDLCILTPRAVADPFAKRQEEMRADNTERPKRKLIYPNKKQKGEIS